MDAIAIDLELSPAAHPANSRKLLCPK